jgi:hypothetical protein
MNQLQPAMVVIAITGTQRGPRDANGQRRVYTVAELDALADFDWPWAGVKSRLVAGVNAMLSRVRPRASTRIEPTPLPSAAATLHG